MDFVWFVVIVAAWIVFDAITDNRDPYDDTLLWNAVEEYVDDQIEFWNDSYERKFIAIAERLTAIEEKLNGLSNPQA